MQGAFAVAEEKRIEIAGRRLVLVDDVMTSGATLNAASRVLLRAGAKQVDALVFARVVRMHEANYGQAEAKCRRFPCNPAFPRKFDFPFSIGRTRTRMPNIVIYTTSTCPYCVRAKALLTKKRARFDRNHPSIPIPAKAGGNERARGRPLHRAADLRRRPAHWRLRRSL